MNIKNVLASLAVLCSLIYSSYACSCGPSSYQDKLDIAENVFRGRVMDSFQDGGDIVYSVKILDKCKFKYPRASDMIEIRTGFHSCGVINLLASQEYTFLTDGYNRIDLCSWDGFLAWDKVTEHCECEEDDSISAEDAVDKLCDMCQELKDCGSIDNKHLEWTRKKVCHLCRKFSSEDCDDEEKQEHPGKKKGHEKKDQDCDDEEKQEHPGKKKGHKKKNPGKKKGHDKKGPGKKGHGKKKGKH